MEKLRLFTSRNAIKTLPIVAGVLLFAAIFGGLTVAGQISSQESQRAFGTTANSAKDLNGGQPDEVETPVVEVDPGTGAQTGGTTTVTNPRQTQPVATQQPAQQAEPAKPTKNTQNPLGDTVTGIVGGVVDTTLCQYPTRPLVNGACDNSDPCDPTTIKDPILHGDCRN